MAKTLVKHHSHTHYFVLSGFLCETYRTIRGLRYQQVLNVGDTKDNDKCSDEQAQELTEKFNK